MVKSNDMGPSTAAVTAIDKMLDQFSGCLNAEAARRVADFKIDSETRLSSRPWARRQTRGESPTKSLMPIRVMSRSRTSSLS